MIHHGYFPQYQTDSWTWGFVYAAHRPAVCCLHLAVYNSVFPQAPTRGQGQHFCGSLIGGEGVCVGVCVFPSLEVLDLYPGAAAG